MKELLDVPIRDRPKITKDQIEVLDQFEYAKRHIFRETFRDLINEIGSQYLLTSVKYPNPRSNPEAIASRRAGSLSDRGGAYRTPRRAHRGAPPPALRRRACGIRAHELRCSGAPRASSPCLSTAIPHSRLCLRASKRRLCFRASKQRLCLRASKHRPCLRATKSRPCLLASKPRPCFRAPCFRALQPK